MSWTVVAFADILLLSLVKAVCLDCTATGIPVVVEEDDGGNDDAAAVVTVVIDNLPHSHSLGTGTNAITLLVVVVVFAVGIIRRHLYPWLSPWCLRDPRASEGITNIVWSILSLVRTTAILESSLFFLAVAAAFQSFSLISSLASGATDGAVTVPKRSFRLFFTSYLSLASPTSWNKKKRGINIIIICEANNDDAAEAAVVPVVPGVPAVPAVPA
jgi:hypothetical protein